MSDVELTNQELQEIQERAERATPGPWRVGEPRMKCKVKHNETGGGHGGRDCLLEQDGWYSHGEPCKINVDKDYEPQPWSAGWSTDGMIVGYIDYEVSGVINRADAEFIAHARTDVERLLRYARSLEQLIQGPPRGK